ncbi:MAG: T9SS type A sorting domain-containing protein [Bacteroidota bacterium]|nr:T9SS type A sorting domain-containing protein [Bacteroidota bacterium]
MKRNQLPITIIVIFFSVFSNIVNAQTYCIPPKFLTGPYTGITNVTVGSINNNSNSTDGYVNYTATVGACTLKRGSNVNFTVSCYYDPGMVGGFTGNLNLRVWIDWNADFDFNDAGEEALSKVVNCSGSTVAKPNTVATYTFTVPAGAVLGNTRMRVYEDMMPDDGHAVPTPCGYNSGLGQHGEAEDYKVIISNTTGTPEIEGNSYLYVYPNPATDYIHIVTDYSDNIDRVTIFNACGKRIQQVKAEELLHQNTIPISDLPMGIYLVIIENKEGKIISSAKFVK